MLPCVRYASTVNVIFYIKPLGWKSRLSTDVVLLEKDTSKLYVFHVFDVYVVQCIFLRISEAMSTM